MLGEPVRLPALGRSGTPAPRALRRRAYAKFRNVRFLTPGGPSETKGGIRHAMERDCQGSGYRRVYGAVFRSDSRCFSLWLFVITRETVVICYSLLEVILLVFERGSSA
ncbi:hypothetical protein D1872_173290 [compost metagenome]